MLIDLSLAECEDLCILIQECETKTSEMHEAYKKLQEYITAEEKNTAIGGLL